jgi:hypothetical protein
MTEKDPLNTWPMDKRQQIDGRAVVLAARRAEWRNALPFWRRIWEAFKGQFER